MTDLSAQRRKQFASPAVKRYQTRFWTLMTLYLLLLSGFIWLQASAPPPGLWRYLAAAAPAVPIVGMVACIGLYLREERDEFLRFFLVASMMWGLGLVLSFTTVWGFLETVGASHLNPYWVFPIFGVSMGVAQPFIWWRYR